MNSRKWYKLIVLFNVLLSFEHLFQHRFQPDWCALKAKYILEKVERISDRKQDFLKYCICLRVELAGKWFFLSWQGLRLLSQSALVGFFFFFIFLKRGSLEHLQKLFSIKECRPIAPELNQAETRTPPLQCATHLSSKRGNNCNFTVLVLTKVCSLLEFFAWLLLLAHKEQWHEVRQGRWKWERNWNPCS